MEILKSTIVFLISLCFLPKSNGQTTCYFIDFENVSGESLSEGLIISDQFALTTGILFQLEDGSFPRLAKVGAPATAFSTSYGDDTPAPNQQINEYFLTDDGVLDDSAASPLIVTFTNPVDSVSGVVLDIDYDEEFVI